MSVVCQVEPLADFEAELLALLPAHEAEFNVYPPPFTSDADYDTYRKIAAAGRMLSITARDDGRLIGYWLGVRFPDPHHRFDGEVVPVVMGQAFFIMPAYRARVAPMLFRCVEREAEREGVLLLAQRVRPGLELRTGEFLQAMGYAAAESVYVKPIGKASDARLRDR